MTVHGALVPILLTASDEVGRFRVQVADVAVRRGPATALGTAATTSSGPRTLRCVLEPIEELVRTDPRPVLLTHHDPVHVDVVETRPTSVRTAGGRDRALCTVGRRAPSSRPTGRG